MKKSFNSWLMNKVEWSCFSQPILISNYSSILVQKNPECRIIIMFPKHTTKPTNPFASDPNDIQRLGLLNDMHITIYSGIVLVNVVCSVGLMNLA